MFFGAPHKGLDTSDLEVMAQAVRGPWQKERVNLVKKLREDAECLEVRVENFVKVLQTRGQDLRVISFYEESMTRKYEMVSTKATQARERNN